MLAFVHKMTHLGLSNVQHFDAGGTVLSGQTTAGTANASDPTAGIAGTVGSVLGTNNNFQATGANITPGTNVAQLNSAYTGAQGALGQAGNLVGTLNPGVAEGAGSQGFLTNQLTKQAQGIGANPAQAQLNQATGQNIAQAAALAAGTRGAGANAGLVAENAARQGAATQQGAIGQSATLQAQQQLAAQQQLQGLAATQVNQGTGAVQLANQAQQNEQNILQGANTAANNAAVSMQGNINTTNAAVAAGNQNADQGVIGSIGSGIKSIGGAIAGLFAEGGAVGKPSMPLDPHMHEMASIYHPHYAGGGEVWQPSNPVQSPIVNLGGPNMPAYTGDFGKSGSGPSAPSAPAGQTSTTQGYGPGSQAMAGGAGDAGGVTDMMSELGPAGMMAAQGGKVPNYKTGGKVPGKAKVGHDDYKNDTVSAKLSPGEVVMDLDTLKDKGKLGQMARFVAQEIERKKAGRKLV